MQRSTKAFGIYYWDTFDPPGQDTDLIDEADTLEAAEALVEQGYAGRLGPGGADYIEIVRERDGEIMRRFNVG